MNNEETYNGYKNYATWNVALWLNNEEGYYNYYREFAADQDFGVNADQAEELVTTVLMPDGTPDFAAFNESYDNVDWNEIANVMNEE